MINLLKEWILQGQDDELCEAVNYYLQAGPYLYNDYEPSPYDRFEDRLGVWLANVTDEASQRALFLLFSKLFFVGRREFESLYRTAHKTIVRQWLIDDAAIDLLANSFDADMARATTATWFCPVTDSLRINAFLKANRLSTLSYRPDWFSLAKFADDSKVVAYIDKHRIRRIALFEDFVGGGTQAAPAIEYACSLVGNRSVIFCPLVISEEGYEFLSALESKYANLSVQPVIVVPKAAHLKPAKQTLEPPQFARIRRFLKGLPRAKTSLRRHLFGFESLGSMVVLYSNCPDNVTSVVHSSDDGWNPLFPRVQR